jgi:hypothetical protein
VQVYVSDSSETRYIAYGLNAAQIRVPSTTSQSITYSPQYKLTIDSGRGSSVGADWYDAGVTANFSIASLDVAGDTRYLFTDWSGNLTSTNANASIVMSSPMTVVANWQTQYYLTVNSQYGNPTGSGWYDAGSQAQFNMASQTTDASGTQYSFASWTGTGSGSYTGPDTIATIIMTGPLTETANWEQTTSLWLVLLVALIIFAVLIAFFLAWRRRKKKKEDTRQTAAPTKKQ